MERKIEVTPQEQAISIIMSLEHLTPEDIKLQQEITEKVKFELPLSHDSQQRIDDVKAIFESPEPLTDATVKLLNF